jgi:hypothetical protein
MAVAKNLDSGLDFDESLFRRRQTEISRQQETGEGLHVSAGEPAARLERTRLVE